MLSFLTFSLPPPLPSFSPPLPSDTLVHEQRLAWYASVIGCLSGRRKYGEQKRHQEFSQVQINVPRGISVRVILQVTPASAAPTNWRRLLLAWSNVHTQAKTRQDLAIYGCLQAVMRGGINYRRISVSISTTCQWEIVHKQRPMGLIISSS